MELLRLGKRQAHIRCRTANRIPHSNYSLHSIGNHVEYSIDRVAKSYHQMQCHLQTSNRHCQQFR
jgi:hypothetical protein